MLHIASNILISQMTAKKNNFWEGKQTTSQTRNLERDLHFKVAF